MRNNVLPVTGLTMLLPLFLILTNVHFDKTVIDYDQNNEIPRSIDFASNSNETNIYHMGKTDLEKSFYKNNQFRASNNHNWSDTFISISKSIDDKKIQKSVRFEFYKTIKDPPKKILDKYLYDIKRSEKEWSPDYFDDKKYYTKPPPEAILLNSRQNGNNDTQNQILSNPNNVSSPNLNGSRATIITSSYVSALGSRSLISEPSIANHGNVVFMTGNWWASRSIDGGKTFSYLDPYSDFSTFCCDQDVVYNKNHNVWVWYRQGVQDSSIGNKNIGRIGVSIDDAVTWCFFNISAQDISASLTSNWLDYSHIQTTQDKLYLSTNIFPVSNGGTVYSAMLRFDLESIKSCSSVPFDVFLTSSTFNLTPVNGATNIMYFGTHLTSSSTRIFKWADSSTSISYNDATYTSYSSLGYSCMLTSEGTNPCGRSDSRILGGYIANGIIGFTWNAAQGGAFPYPYTNHIRVNEATGTIIDNPMIYSPTYAINYASVAVNSNGDIGIAHFIMGGTQKPAYVVGIHDSLTPGNSFDFTTVKTSTNGPTVSNAWGDFIRVKADDSNNGQWISSGYTLQGGSVGTNVEILDIIFGRCLPPTTGDWTILQSCTLTSSLIGSTATIVLGQSSFTTNTSNPPTASILQTPVGHAFDSAGNLWVADSNNNRILMYPQASLGTSGSAATIVLGQSSFTTATASTTTSTLYFPVGLAFDSAGNLWVADTNNNRILMYPQASLGTSGSAATIVLGQSS
ncbi:MAG: hypothetical protein ACYC9R_10805, partial [Nitrosotalea sp.]